MLDPFGEEAATMNGDLFQVRLVALLPAYCFVFVINRIKCESVSCLACLLELGGSFNVPRLWMMK